MSGVKSVVTGLVGLGGYAGSIFDVLERTQPDPAACLRLVAVTSSNPDKHPERVERAKKLGARIVPSFDELLADPQIEAVWLPLPIELHRPFTEKALAAGKAVMCEKPVAGTVDDLDAMVAARDKHRRPVAIGFQDVYHPTTVPVKQRLLDGRIGKIQSATLYACWPRGYKYYHRNNWAGKLKSGGAWVLDSPANNALAHYINITLHMLGPSLEEAAQVTAVEAELYRVNPIENYDTISMRLTLAGGVTFLVHLTHACRTNINPEIVIHGQKGRMVRTNERVVFETPAGREEIDRTADPRNSMVRRFNQFVRGIPNPDTVVATLETSRPPLVAINGASEATAVRNVPQAAVETVPGDERTGPIITIRDIEAAFARASAEQKMLHELSLGWTSPAGRKDMTGYKHFAGPRTA